MSDVTFTIAPCLSFGALFLLSADLTALAPFFVVVLICVPSSIVMVSCDAARGLLLDLFLPFVAGAFRVSSSTRSFLSFSTSSPLSSFASFFDDASAFPPPILLPSVALAALRRSSSLHSLFLRPNGMPCSRRSAQSLSPRRERSDSVKIIASSNTNLAASILSSAVEEFQLSRMVSRRSSTVSSSSSMLPSSLITGRPMPVPSFPAVASTSSISLRRSDTGEFDSDDIVNRSSENSCDLSRSVPGGSSRPPPTSSSQSSPPTTKRRGPLLLRSLVVGGSLFAHTVVLSARRGRSL
mmetsp:Transcript_7985/g.33606  ORF Transcript_7985/g.33606 Transcript_7985/m.33606 type:complete len:296 (-) Transcript_7985:114-1001(-)